MKKDLSTLRDEYQQIINESKSNPAIFDRVLPLAEAGLAEAQWFVGNYYMYYKKREDGYKERIEHCLRLSAKQHYPPAELALGEWLYYGRNTFKTDPECEKWLRLAAKHKQAKASYFLGRLAKKKGDMATACYWWRIGTNMGDNWSQQELAFCHETAQGVAYNLHVAIHWYKEAIKNENFEPIDAYYHIAVLKKYALKKYASLSGLAAEQFLKGEKAMENGNLRQAVELWYDSSIGGDPRGIVMRAWQMLHVVEGIVENDGDEYFDDELFFEEEEQAIKAVVEFFSMQKHPSAYYLKGYLYEHGICYIKPDLDKAIHWYEKAANAGDQVATWKLENIKEKSNNNLRNNEDNF